MQVDTSQQSPNRSSRAGAPVSMLVLHATVGSYASALAWLCNPASRVSTHYLIRKDGHIAQLVPDEFAAHHAGVSQWFGMSSDAIRRQSIGIELENRNTGTDPYPPAQMAAVTELAHYLIGKYSIVPDMVTRHLSIAMPRGRKTDPAGFPWEVWKPALYAARQYTVVGLPIYQRSDHIGELAGYLLPGEVVTINDLSNGHLADERGFVDLNGLKPA